MSAGSRPRPGGGYASALATVLHGSAIPYGYTVSIWTSGVVLIRHRGLPTTGQAFLFVVGAVAAFVVLGSIVSLSRAAPVDPPPGALRHTGMSHLLAIGGALGLASLISMIKSGVDWPLGSFAVTAAYLGLATLVLRTWWSPPRAR